MLLRVPLFRVPVAALPPYTVSVPSEVCLPVSDVPKLKRLQVRGLRSCVDVRLDLPEPPLVVLIGPNMSGKSTLLDALRLLGAAAREPKGFATEIQLRGGLSTMRSSGAGVEFSLEATVGGYDYKIAATDRLGTRLCVVDALKVRGGSPVFERAATATRSEAFLAHDDDGTVRELPIDEDSTVLGLAIGGVSGTVRDGISRCAVYASPRVVPAWVATPGERGEDPRAPTFVGPAARIHARGLEVANALASIRDNNSSGWSALLDDVKFGFPFVGGLSFPAVVGGRISIKWQDTRRAMDSYADQMSDGMLAYLMLLAAIHSAEPASALGFDEPEVHLHPTLLGRIVARLEEKAEAGTAIVIATHSDALLDHLAQPEKAVLVCTNDDHGGTRIKEPMTHEELNYWRKTYNMSTLRQRGQLDAPNEPT